MEKVKDMFFLDAETRVRVFEKGISISQANADILGTYASNVRLTTEQLEILYKRLEGLKNEKN